MAKMLKNFHEYEFHMYLSKVTMLYAYQYKIAHKMNYINFQQWQDLFNFRYIVLRLKLICRCANPYFVYLCSTVIYKCFLVS